MYVFIAEYADPYALYHPSTRTIAQSFTLTFSKSNSRIAVSFTSAAVTELAAIGPRKPGFLDQTLLPAIATKKGGMPRV